MNILKTSVTAAWAVGLVGVVSASAAEKNFPAQLQTANMGGVPALTKKDLIPMQQGAYLLRCRDGSVTQVPAEKIKLTHDPKGHVQIVNTAMGPDGAIYVNQGSIICRSTDGGRAWTSYPRQEGPSGTFSFKVLSNGTFIAAGRLMLVTWSAALYWLLGPPPLR